MKRDSGFSLVEQPLIAAGYKEPAAGEDDVDSPHREVQEKEPPRARFDLPAQRGEPPRAVGGTSSVRPSNTASEPCARSSPFVETPSARVNIGFPAVPPFR